MVIVMPIGISGSGKSRLYNISYSDYEKVCPDDIRYELTGNISDQSRNKDVFRIVEKRIDECVKNGDNVFYDATNVCKNIRKKFIDKIKKYDNVYIIYCVFPANIEVSYERIKNDLQKGVNRSKVSLDVLKKQFDMYKHSIDVGFDDECVDEIIYI